MVMWFISWKSKKISPVIHKMNNGHQGQKRVQPSQNPEEESINKKVQLSWSNNKSDHLSYSENLSNSKLSNDINESHQNKTLPKAKVDNQGLLEEQVDKNSEYWNIKFVSQIESLEFSHLKFCSTEKMIGRRKRCWTLIQRSTIKCTNKSNQKSNKLQNTIE